MTAHVKDQSYVASELEDGIPLIVDGDAESKLYFTARLDKGHSQSMERVLKSDFIYTGSMNTGKSIHAQGIVKARSHILAELDVIHNEKDTWWDPVQSGSNLYIRSAYPQWQENTNVHLDSGGVWYDPVQNGTDLYIRMNDNTKGIENE